jgi:hypothetical protein
LVIAVAAVVIAPAIGAPGVAVIIVGDSSNKSVGVFSVAVVCHEHFIGQLQLFFFRKKKDRTRAPLEPTASGRARIRAVAPACAFS